MQNIRATLFFRASACKLLETRECITYIQYSEKFQSPLFFRASASYSKILNNKNMYSIQYIQGTFCSSGQAQVAQKFWMLEVYSIQRKISGQLCLSGQTLVAQKSWMIKIHVQIQWKISGQLCFSGQAHANCSKILNVKSIFHTAKRFGTTLFFRASAICSKILNDQNYFNTVKNSRANPFFRESASCSKILNIKNI